jgi:hypothetical protein
MCQHASTVLTPSGCWCTRMSTGHFHIKAGFLPVHSRIATHQFKTAVRHQTVYRKGEICRLTRRISHLAKCFPSPSQRCWLETGMSREACTRQLSQGRSLTRVASKFAQTHQAPPDLKQMSGVMRASGAGVVVLSCSDPRLNPYQILGIDSTLSECILVHCLFPVRHTYARGLPYGCCGVSID